MKTFLREVRLGGDPNADLTVFAVIKDCLLYTSDAADDVAGV